MTPEQFEAQVKTMLADTAKGLATKEEFTKAHTELVAQYEAQQKALEDAQTQVKELSTAVPTLQRQVKALQASGFASIKDGSGHYHGVWGSLQQAKMFGLFTLASLAGNKKAETQLKELGGIEIMRDKDMDAQTNTAGGALIPTEFVDQLIVLIEEYGVYRRHAGPWPMGSDQSLAPIQTGDVTVYCPGAGTTATKSQPTLSNIGLTAQKWMTLTAIDSEVDEDAAVAVGELVGKSIARAFATQEDKCGFVGDGTSTYFGNVGLRGALTAVDATPGNVAGFQVQGTAGAWSAITANDLLGVISLLAGYADTNDTAFYCSRQFYYTVMVSVALALGGTNATEAITMGHSRNPQFQGWPVHFTQAMPTSKPAADHCPLLFGDLSLAAKLGDRRKLTIDQSREAYFTTDQIGIRGTERIAMNNAFAVGDTTNAGAVVGLWADIA